MAPGRAPPASELIVRMVEIPQARICSPAQGAGSRGSSGSPHPPCIGSWCAMGQLSPIDGLPDRARLPIETSRWRRRSARTWPLMTPALGPVTKRQTSGGTPRQ